MNCDEYSSIPDWIIEHPESASVFGKFGLDTSCGGKSLQYVCRKEDIELQHLLEELSEAIQAD